MPGSSPAARRNRVLNLDGQMIRTARFLSGTMALVLTWRMRHDCLGSFSGCTLPRSFLAPAWGWRRSSESSTVTGVGPGPQANRMKGQLFISPCPTMTTHTLAELPGAARSHLTEEKPGLRQGVDREQDMAVKGPLQVLIVEDSENDAALLELELQQAGYDTICQRV